jgi:hypothetical protein
MKKTVLSLMGILALSHLAYAGGDIVATEESVVEAPIVVEDSDWEFRLTPYIWFAGFEGDVASIPGLPVVPIDISPSDAFDDAEVSVTAMFEGKKNGKGFFVDFLYSDLQSEETLIKSINLALNATTKTTVFSAGYLHELYNQEQSVVDVFVGLRYWEIDTYLSFSGGLGILAGRGIGHVESWVDPLIGIKGRTPLGDTSFYATGGVAIGGFGVGSDLFYDANANIGYQWSESIGTTVGYRVYDLDYEDDGFVYDVTQQGWIFGLTWAF